MFREVSGQFRFDVGEDEMSEEREYDDCFCRRCRSGAPCAEFRTCERCSDSLCFDCFEPRAAYCKQCDPPPSLSVNLTKDPATWPKDNQVCWIEIDGGAVEDMTWRWVKGEFRDQSEEFTYVRSRVSRWQPANPPVFDI